MLNEWAAQRTRRYARRSHRRRLLPLGRRQRALTTQTRVVHGRSRRADCRCRGRSATGAGLSRASPARTASRTGIRRSRSTSRACGRSTSATGTSTAPRRKRSSAYERGRDLWHSRYGAADVDAVPLCRHRGRRRRCATRFGDELRATLSPQAMGVALFPARAAALERHRRARRTSASTSPTSASSSSSPRCCSPCCSSSSASSSACGRSASCARPATRWRRSGGCSLGEAPVLAAIGRHARRSRARSRYGRLIVYGLRHVVGRRRRHDAARAAREAGSLAIGALGGVHRGSRCACSCRCARSARSDAARAADGAVARCRPRWPGRPARAPQPIPRVCLRGCCRLALLGDRVRVMPSAQAGAFFGAGAALLRRARCSWLVGLAARRATRARSPGAGRGPSPGWVSAARRSGRRAASSPRR